MSTAAPPYRNARNEVAMHAKRLLAGHVSIDEDKLGAIYRRRSARIAFGIAGTYAGGLTLLFIALAERGQTLALALAWLAAFISGGVAYLRAGRRYQQARNKSLGANDDPYDLVIRLSHPNRREETNHDALASLEKLGLASHRWPLLAGAILLPLTLLTGFFALFSTSLHELDQINRFALVCTAHVHIFAMVSAWRYPRKQNAMAAVGIAAALGVIPFIISALVVAPVALVIVLICHYPIGRCVARENAWIVAAQSKNTTAVASPL